MDEAQLYQNALDDAKERLARWEAVGKQLDKTLDDSWRSILSIRQAEVKQLELLIQRAEHRL